MKMRWQILILISLIGFSPAVFAYLDPSTGSMLISAIVGIIASVALALKTYWYRLKNLFRHSSAETPPDDNAT
jgi:O-antigen/teichoic acid export membrane protein